MNFAEDNDPEYEKNKRNLEMNNRKQNSNVL